MQFCGNNVSMPNVNFTLSTSPILHPSTSFPLCDLRRMRSHASVLSLCLGQVDTRIKCSFSFRIRVDRGYCQHIEESKVEPKSCPNAPYSRIDLRPWLDSIPRNRTLNCRASQIASDQPRGDHWCDRNGKVDMRELRLLMVQRAHSSWIGVTRASRFFFR